MSKNTDTAISPNNGDLMAQIAEANDLKPCECQRFTIEVWSGEVPDGEDPGNYVDYLGTGCGQYTTRTFAPGHDAKLKSLLIQAGAQDLGVRRSDGGVDSIGDAMKHAEYYGFGHQVAAGISRAKNRLTERAEKKAAKLAARLLKAELAAAAKADKPAKTPKAAPQPLVEPTKIKVGRWTYEAIIHPTDNSAEYTSSNGETKTAEPGKYKIVTA